MAAHGTSGHPSAGGRSSGLPDISRRSLLQGSMGAVLLGGLAACGGGGGGTTGASTAPAAAGTPVRGGTLRVGVIGGGANDLIDGQYIVAKPDQARLVAGWETLVTYDKDFKIVNEGLAE